MKVIWKLIQFMLTAVLFTTAVHFCDSADEAESVVTAVLDGDALTAQEAEEICTGEAEQNEPMGTCFYGEQETTVSCEENGKSTNVTLILATGNLTLLSDAASPLNWVEDACLIDTDTAWTLFGSERAAGQILQMDGNAYTVCGTFESEKNVVIRNAVSADEKVLTGVLLKNPGGNGSNIVSRAEQFLSRHGLSGNVISFVYLHALARDLLLLAPLLLFIKCLRYARRHLLRSPGSCSDKWNLTWEVSSATLFCLLVWLFQTRFTIPSDMIPTAWSDFSFWSSWWQSRKQDFFLLLGSAQGVMQISLIWKLTVSVCCSISADFLALLI